MSRLPVLALLCLTGACGGASPRGTYRPASGSFTRGEERFRAPPPPGPWLRADSADGDVAWYHPRVHAMIAANAACRGHRDPPLHILLNDLLIGTTHRKQLLHEDLMLDGRAALHEVWFVRVDGVPLIYDLYVLKKNGCVYDLSLIAPPQAYDRTADTFVGFVAQFHGTGVGH